MIVLDTNVISELMRPAPSDRVIGWLDRQLPEAIWLTSISVLEIRFGLELLEDGARRLRLEQAFDVVLAQDLAERVLSFDLAAADHTARLAASARRAGQSMELRDAMIAGIALRHRARLATRNLRHFEHTEIDLEDPWR